jgi:LDH2 family malate/lactate/ureidoglycolate dehydrogenase
VIRVSHGTLVSFATDVFVACGLPRRRAACAAEALCYADAVGMDTHGIANLESIYVTQLRTGAIAADAQLHTVGAEGCVAVLDACGGLGLWVGAEAMDRAVALAKQHGVGAVAVRNSTHLGATGFYARRATNEHCIGIAMSNCGAQRIAPSPAGGAPVLGTNPLAIAVPGGDFPPFVLDMSTTVMPAGRVRAAAAAGERLPVGVLARSDGEPETDPRAYERGEASLLWLGSDPRTGAHKGFGLGLAVDLLAGLLSGAATGPASEPGLPDRDVGHFFVAVEIAKFREPDAFISGFDEIAFSLCEASCQEGAAYPGGPEAATRAERERDGVPLPAHVIEMLDRVGLSCGVAADGVMSA